MKIYSTSDHALDSRARRAAMALGYVTRKTRLRSHSIDNHGGFMLVDSSTNCAINGFFYDLSARDVIEWCRTDQ